MDPFDNPFTNIRRDTLPDNWEEAESLRLVMFYYLLSKEFDFRKMEILN